MFLPCRYSGLTKLFLLAGLVFNAQLSWALTPIAQKKAIKIQDDFSNLKNLGEKKHHDNAGPLDPGPQAQEIEGEQRWNKEFPLWAWFPEIGEWLKRSGDFLDSTECSDYSLSQTSTYSRYLYRLITLSYLFEALRELSKENAQIAGSANNCPLTWKLFFKQWKGPDAEMKKLSLRSKKVFADWGKVQAKAMGAKELSLWLENFDQKPYSTLIQKLSALDLKTQKQTSWDKKEVEKLIAQKCQMITSFVHLIGQEKDKLMGMQSISLASELILKSNAMAVLNLTTEGEGCLKRFSHELKEKEEIPLWLGSVFEHVKKSIEADQKRRYLQGYLFLPGALKEFDDRGLKDFLYKPQIPKPVKVVVKAPPKKIIEPRPTPTPVPVVIVSKPVVKKIIPPPPEVVKISEFKKASDLRRQKDLKSLEVNLEKFAQDFVLDEKKAQELDKLFVDYTKREALKDMREVDSLGSSQEPIHLLFLKRLIETQKHAALYNIQAEIGDKFYVVNDVDNAPLYEYVELKEDPKARFHWSLSILKVPEKKAQAQSGLMPEGPDQDKRVFEGRVDKEKASSSTNKRPEIKKDSQSGKK